MQNAPVPANADLLKSATVQRRTFMMGAALSLIVPQAAVAAEAVTPRNELALLIERHAEVSRAFDEADAEAIAIYARADRPQLPEISPGEQPMFINTLTRKPIYLKKQIDALVDDYIVDRKRFHQWASAAQPAGMTQGQADALRANIAQAEAHRPRLHRLFDERQATFDAWAIASGHKAATERYEAIYEELSELEDEILSYPCVTLSQVAMKAAFIFDEYGDNYSQEHQHVFIQEVASLTKAASRPAVETSTAQEN